MTVPGAQDDPQVMRARLERWTAAHHGAGARLGAIERLPGHAGITFAFDVHTGDQADRAGAPPVDRLVVRVPPAGVRRQGTTDVLRQVPLLQVMEREGVPVPRVRWWGEDEQWFGVPFIIVDRVPGSTLGDVFAEDPPSTPDADTVTSVFGEAVDALVTIHGVDWQRALGDWADTPRTLHAELDYWVPVLEKAGHAEWLAQGLELRGALMASSPPEPEPGVVHADFYSNNWMVLDGHLTAVLDWEATFIGPRLLDLGWLCLIFDPESWGPTRRRHMGWSPSLDFLAERYEAAAGAPVRDLGWYRALAAYRLACLTAHYLGLHRRGRRHDPVWEVFGEAVPHMVRRARRLVEG